MSPGPAEDLNSSAGLLRNQTALVTFSRSVVLGSAEDRGQRHRTKDS